jgi:Arc/MetJ-type ribon-helix-helix transcriptional regulator
MASTEQLTIDLSAELLSDLRNSIQSGEFASESEAIELILPGMVPRDRRHRTSMPFAQ